MQQHIDLPNNNHLKWYLCPWYNHGDETVQHSGKQSRYTLPPRAKILYLVKRSVDDEGIYLLSTGEAADISVSVAIDFPTGTLTYQFLNVIITSIHISCCGCYRNQSQRWTSPQLCGARGNSTANIAIFNHQ
jgi:hypothetical protein